MRIPGGDKSQTKNQVGTPVEPLAKPDALVPIQVQNLGAGKVPERFGGEQTPGLVPQSKLQTLDPAVQARIGPRRASASTEIAAITPRQVAKTADEQEYLEDLAAAFYPLDHPKLHLVSGVIDLDKIGVGRTNETGKLTKVALSMPYALGGDWKFSPMAQSKGFDFDLCKALEQHAALAKHLIDSGVEVYLQLQVEGASEAVYATDTVTGIGKTAFVGNPKYEARKLERDAYSGGVDLAKFGGAKGPIEFGDVLLFEKNGTQYVFQGYNSWRGTEASVDAMRTALKFLQKRGDIENFELVPIELSGEDTLHLDFVVNYAGEGDRRVMTVWPEGLADPKMVDKLSQILDVPEDRIIRVNKDEMLHAAANLENLSPTEVLYVDNEHSQRVAGEMRKHGLTVTQFKFDQMTQKDGALHCCVGQLARE